MATPPNTGEEPANAEEEFTEEAWESRRKAWQEELKLIYDFAKQITTLDTASVIILATLSRGTRLGIPPIPLLLMGASAAAALLSMLWAMVVLRAINRAGEPGGFVRFQATYVGLIGLNAIAVGLLITRVVLYAMR